MQITWSNSNLAVSAAVTSTVVGIRVTNLLNLSTTVKMQSYPRAVVGKNVIKSKEMCSNGLQGTE